MAHTLKLRDSKLPAPFRDSISIPGDVAELSLPGLALPEAFEDLEKRLDSALKLCKLSTPPDGQVLGVIAICQELQRLLKCAFIGTCSRRGGEGVLSNCTMDNFPRAIFNTISAVWYAVVAVYIVILLCGTFARARVMPNSILFILACTFTFRMFLQRMGFLPAGWKSSRNIIPTA